MAEKSAIQWTDADKWCIGCKTYHDRKEFGSDKSRRDGLASKCRAFKNSDERKRYVKKPRPEKGRRFVPIRNGDELQARRRVNYLVESKIIPNPNSLPCHDCNHLGNDIRHEYDHYNGYEEKYHETVQCVCAKCHKLRTNGRKKQYPMV